MLLQMMAHLNLSIIFHKVLRKVFKTFSAVIFYYIDRSCMERKSLKLQFAV